MSPFQLASSLFFFNDPAPTEIYPLPLPDALPIPTKHRHRRCPTLPDTTSNWRFMPKPSKKSPRSAMPTSRSEEHTSELQSHSDLVCRLLLEKKKHTRSNETADPRALGDGRDRVQP